MSHIIFVTLLLRSIVLLPRRSDNTYNYLLNFHSPTYVVKIIYSHLEEGGCLWFSDAHISTISISLFVQGMHTTCRTPKQFFMLVLSISKEENLQALVHSNNYNGWIPHGLTIGAIRFANTIFGPHHAREVTPHNIVPLFLGSIAWLTHKRYSIKQFHP